MNDTQLQEPTLAATTIYDGKIIKLEKLNVQLPNGKTSVREVVRHPGAVAVVAESKPGHLLLVRQFRKPMEEVLWEVPAGKLEPGEATSACAIRELSEETGYQAKHIETVSEFFTSPGFADEKIYLFYASDLQPGVQQTDEDEFVQVVELSEQAIRELLQNGEIRDAKTLVGLLWWLQHREVFR